METYTDESTHTSLFHSHECCTAVFVSSLRIFPAFVGFVKNSSSHDSCAKNCAIGYCLGSFI